MTQPMVPTIHLNGSSGDELFKQAYAAYEAIDIAAQKLHDAFPHGRDYYPQGDNSYPVARQEAISRIQAIENVRGELQQVLVGLTNEYHRVHGKYPQLPVSGGSK